MRKAYFRTGCALLGALALVLLSGCGTSNDLPGTTPSSRVTTLSPEAYDRALSSDRSAFVVNVHIPYEGEIAGTAAFVPFDQVSQNAALLPADRSAPLYIYCRSGRMSAGATPALQALGYTNIIDLKGGMNAWRAAGLPIVEKRP